MKGFSGCVKIDAKDCDCLAAIAGGSAVGAVGGSPARSASVACRSCEMQNGLLDGRQAEIARTEAHDELHEVIKSLADGCRCPRDFDQERDSRSQLELSLLVPKSVPDNRTAGGKSRVRRAQAGVVPTPRVASRGLHQTAAD